MRPIKFRAWNKEKKVMVDLYKITPLALADDLHHQDGLYIPFDDRLELMQFTGLLDKNGKPVFEGDIIIEGGNTAEVFWDQPFARWAYRTRTGTAGMYLFIGEVIGNIHENPELLK